MVLLQLVDGLLQLMILPQSLVGTNSIGRITNTPITQGVQLTIKDSGDGKFEGITGGFKFNVSGSSVFQHYRL